MAKPSSHSDHYATITSSILAALEAGTRPWAKPWETKGGAQVLDFSLPFNGASGRQYRGINVPWLFCEAYAKGYTSQAWLTFSQAQQLGGSVMRGEKATHVFFAKQITVKERANDGTETTKPVYLLRAFPVFNAAQCSGVQLPTRARPEPATPTTDGLGVVGPVVERLKLASGLHYGGSRALYAPSADRIQLPSPQDFRTRDGFLVTLLHECGHATGHESRLARTFGRCFGDETYAAEELVAELCSAMTQAVLGIRADVVDHASYIDSWISVLRKDKRAFVKAASMAQRAADYLLGVERESQAEEQPIELQAAA